MFDKIYSELAVVVIGVWSIARAINGLLNGKFVDGDKYAKSGKYYFNRAKDVRMFYFGIASRILIGIAALRFAWKIYHK